MLLSMILVANQEKKICLNGFLISEIIVGVYENAALFSSAD